MSYPTTPSPTQQPNWTQKALAAGLTDIIPVIPPDAPLVEGSRVDPKQCGKIPGEYYDGGWNSTAGWPEYQMDTRLAEHYDSLGANVGLKCGYQWVALDVDILDDLTMQAVRQALIDDGVTAPIRVGKAPKALWLFRVSGEPIRRRQYPIKQLDAAGEPVLGLDGKPVQAVVDVMGVSRKGRPTQCVILGTHPLGVQYTWESPLVVADVPTVTAVEMDALVEVVLGVCDDRGWTRGRPSGSGGSSMGRTSALGLPHDRSLIPDLLARLPNDDLVWDEWVRIGLLIQTLLGSDDGWDYWVAWSLRSAKFDLIQTEASWDSFEPTGELSFGSLVHYTREMGVCDLILDSRISADAKWRTAIEGGMPLVPEPYVAPVVGVKYVDGLPAGGGLPMAVAVVSKEPAAKMPVPADEPMGEVDYVRKTDGSIVVCFKNLVIWLTNDDRWRHSFAYDAFADRSVVLHPIPGAVDQSHAKIPRPLADNDYLDVRGWFQQHGFPRVAKGDVIDAVDNISVRNSFEPVQHYLQNLPAVLPGLLDQWLFKFMGVAGTGDVMQDHYVSQIGRKWLIGAVARAMRPGCQMDNALVFEGEQGVGKSSAFRALCPDPEWFGDSLPDFQKKPIDASEYLAGKWIVEMSELASIRKSDQEEFRSFLTRRIENYVPKYVRRTVYRPRRCVFAGSTNRDDYLKDSAGERRIWPVKVGTVDIDGLLAARDTLWREALDAYESCEVWYLDDDVSAHATEQQKDRVEIDPLVEQIQPLIKHMSEVCAKHIWDILKSNMSDDQRSDWNLSNWDQRVSRRITKAVGVLGYKTTKTQIDSGKYKNCTRLVRSDVLETLRKMPK